MLPQLRNIGRIVIFGLILLVSFNRLVMDSPLVLRHQIAVLLPLVVSFDLLIERIVVVLLDLLAFESYL